MSVRIGIMQGRLLPPIQGRIQAFPKERWPEEFPIARSLGFDNIEFIFDMDGDDIEAHPLLERPCRTIASLVALHQVAVTTTCGDYFMAHPLHGKDPADAERSAAMLSRLVENTRSLGSTDIVFPCVDNSRLVTEDDRRQLVQRLARVLPLCERLGVNIALETDLGPSDFRELLDRFESPRATVNYDLGNSASLGYDPGEEWEAYGQRVSSVHIKDRLLGGPTVPLGTGAAQFEKFFQVVARRGYRGLFVLQAARGRDEVATARQYRQFLAGYIRKYLGQAKAPAPGGKDAPMALE